MKNIVKKNENYLMEIVDMGHNGEGIGRVEGFTVFADGGVPGDSVEVKIDIVKKNYAIGTIVEIKKASLNRVKPNCSSADICGGCQMQHIDYLAQLRWKKNVVKANIERIGKLEDITIHETLGMNNPYYYRNKAQFPVSKRNKEAVIGFYKRKSHNIVDIDTCLIQHEVNDKVINIVRDYINQYSISTYDEKTGKGLIRHVLTKIGFHTKQIMVVLITNGKEIPHKKELINKLTDEIPNIKSIVQNINTKKGNRILGQTCITLYGEDKIIDYIGDLKFNISPLSFFQVNPIQTKVLYEKALEYAGLTGEENVYDIYCGIGTISLFLAKKAKYVYGIEVVEAAIKDAKENAKINSIDNVDFFAGLAEEVVPKLYKEGHKADVVVIDPPRKGCDELVLDTIVKMNPKTVVYVSCNPSTLARDLKYLDEHGYKTVEVQPVDMFPHTTHVETVVRIEKAFV